MQTINSNILGLLNTEEVAEILGVSPATVRQWVLSGFLVTPCYSRSNITLWRESAIRAFLENERRSEFFRQRREERSIRNAALLADVQSLIEQTRSGEVANHG